MNDIKKEIFEDSDLEVEVEDDIDLDNPKKYKVILLNDDFTTMEFVIEILVKIFHKNYYEAVDIMLKIHESGKGVCGVFTYDIAETKMEQVVKLARENNFPLKAIMEEE